MGEQEKKTEKRGKTAYTKEQIIRSEKFRNRSDLAEAVLEQDKKYTLAEARQLLENYLKGRKR